MSLTSISTYMLNKVKAISGVDPRGVFDYEDSKWAFYPAISVTLKEWKSQFLTNQQNRQDYVFTIRIYQEIQKDNIGPETGEANLRALADNIIASFNSDLKLGSNVVYTLPVSGRTGWVADQPIRTYEIDVECRDVVTAVG